MKGNCEILAPAGGESSAYAALAAGADAVYLGLSRFSARAGAENFHPEALRRVTRRAHLLGAKVYVALNTLVKDGETGEFFAAVKDAWEAGADAILLQDMFLGARLKEAYPQLVLHLSTQAGCCNVYGAELAKKMGFSRAVLARETPLTEIGEISKVIETEAFVQGALCSSVSGQCYFSSFAGNHSGNRGQCKQPCRKRYSIDRAGFEEKKYALSLSDLCVGERVTELLAAGVSSLKIEGRMRRETYVAAAVEYYRTLLAGGDGAAAFSRLKRAYNRGDYTQGLCFGQDARFLSREVQGHIGEEVGAVCVRAGRYFCASKYSPLAGDAFKILRGGREVCGAKPVQRTREGFYLLSERPLCDGDRVRLTTDTSFAAPPERRRRISLNVRLRAGEAPRVSCGTFVYTGDCVPQTAQSAPMSESEIKACFQKTDMLPLDAEVHADTEGVFLPKSQLNGLRRAFYAALCDWMDPPRPPLQKASFSASLPAGQGSMTAAIARSLDGLAADILIYKPADYKRIDMSEVKAGKGKKYLYLPAFFTREDEAAVKDVLPQFDGIYCEGYYGLVLAEKYGMPLFAGTGFNVTNRFAAEGVLRAGAAYFSLSKELTAAEQRALLCGGAFTLAAGSVKLMDLVYCPFGRTCGGCDQRPFYTLTDEAGRAFPLARYRFSGAYCRFEVYNCASLAAYCGEGSVICDLSAERAGQPLIEAARSPERVKRLVPAATKGHADRSLL